MAKKQRIDSFQMDLSGFNEKETSILTPLEKCGNTLSVDDILKSDRRYAQVGFISSMMIHGYDNKTLAEKYEEHFNEKISVSTIAKLKNLARQVYLAQIGKNRDELVAEHLARADAERRELYDAWEKSKNGKHKKSVKTATSRGDSPEMNYDSEETTEDFEESAGDINFLKQIDAVNKREIELLGLNAPKQAAENPNAVLPNVVINVVGNRKDIKVEEAELVSDGEGTEQE